MKPPHRHLLLLLALTLLGCSPLLRGKSERQAHLDKAANKVLLSSSFRGASWSIMAVDLQGGRILMTRDEDRSLIPASSLKLLGTACALETLGPDYRIATTIGYTGRIESDGTLNGDLIVIGAGDPTMSSRFWDSTDTFSAWCDSLLRKNIRRIQGDVVGYAGLFKGDPLGAGWEWDDLPEWFAAEFSPLTYSDGSIELVITPAESIGQPATIQWSPQGDFASVRGVVSTVASEDPSEISYNRQLASNAITVWGTVAVGSPPQRRWISVHHPADLFLKTLESQLHLKGISLTGKTVMSTSWQPGYADFKLLFVDLSPPLKDLIRIINQHSHNQYAEMLVRVLGVKQQAADLWGLNAADDAFTAGRERIRQWEATLVGPGTGLVMVDGSGLSRRNLLCASEILKVLAHMNRSPYRWEFVNSLAIPGVGTLKDSFRGLPQGITLHAKTGTLTRVKALSGYLGEAGYPRIAFSILCNNYLCSSEEVDLALENLCQILALYLKEG